MSDGNGFSGGTELLQELAGRPDSNAFLLPGDMQALSQGKGLSGACILGSLGTQITTWLSPLLLGVLDLSQVWWRMRASPVLRRLKAG